MHCITYTIPTYKKNILQLNFFSYITSFYMNLLYFLKRFYIASASASESEMKIILNASAIEKKRASHCIGTVTV